MKKLSLLFCFVLLSTITKAQFKVVPGGITTDNGMSFIIQTMDGSQHDLFTKAKAALELIYKGAKDELSSEKEDAITVKSDVKDAIRIRYCGKKMDGSLAYSMTFRFKDNKMRIDIPKIISYTYNIHPNFDKEIKANILLAKGPYRIGKGKKKGKEYINDIYMEHTANDVNAFKEDGSIRIDDAVSGLADYLNNIIDNFMKKMDNVTKEESW
jgi:hypothetical protein